MNRKHYNRNASDNFSNATRSVINNQYYSTDFRNAYNSMGGDLDSCRNPNLDRPTSEKTRQHPNLPNILNFDLNEQVFDARILGRKMDTCEQNDLIARDGLSCLPLAGNLTARDGLSCLPLAGNLTEISNETNSNSEKRCGIKKLIDARSELIYPFDKKMNSSQNLPYASSSSNLHTLYSSTNIPYTSSTSSTSSIPYVSSVQSNSNHTSSGLTQSETVNCLPSLGPIPDTTKGYVDQVNLRIEKEALGFKENLVEDMMEHITPINEEKKNIDKLLDDPNVLNTDQKTNRMNKNGIPIGFVCNHNSIKNIQIKNDAIPMEPCVIKSDMIDVVSTDIRTMNIGSNKLDIDRNIESEIINPTCEMVDKCEVGENEHASESLLTKVNGPMKINPIIHPVSLNSSYMSPQDDTSYIEYKSIRENNIKKIDIINHNNIMLNMDNNNHGQDDNMSEKRRQIQIPIIKQCESPIVEKNGEPMDESNKEASLDNKEISLDIKQVNADMKINTEHNWPELSIDLIGTSFKVIADLPLGAKLKIVNNTHLAEDDSYLCSLSRYSTGQGRDKIISFLDHLFSESERRIWTVLEYIRIGKDVDKNVSVMRGIIGKMFVFLHRYDEMRKTYKNDSSAYARLGIIRDKYFTFLDTYFRDMAIPKKD